MLYKDKPIMKLFASIILTCFLTTFIIKDYSYALSVKDIPNLAELKRIYGYSSRELTNIGSPEAASIERNAQQYANSMKSTYQKQKERIEKNYENQSQYLRDKANATAKGIQNEGEGQKQRALTSYNNNKQQYETTFQARRQQYVSNYQSRADQIDSLTSRYNGLIRKIQNIPHIDLGPLNSVITSIDNAQRRIDTSMDVLPDFAKGEADKYKVDTGELETSDLSAKAEQLQNIPPKEYYLNSIRNKMYNLESKKRDLIQARDDALLKLDNRKLATLNNMKLSYEGQLISIAQRVESYIATQKNKSDDQISTLQEEFQKNTDVLYEQTENKISSYLFGENGLYTRAYKADDKTFMRDLASAGDMTSPVIQSDEDSGGYLGLGDEYIPIENQKRAYLSNQYLTQAEQVLNAGASDSVAKASEFAAAAGTIGKNAQVIMPRKFVSSEIMKGKIALDLEEGVPAGAEAVDKDFQDTLAKDQDSILSQTDSFLEQTDRYVGDIGQAIDEGEKLAKDNLQKSTKDYEDASALKLDNEMRSLLGFLMNLNRYIEMIWPKETGEKYAFAGKDLADAYDLYTVGIWSLIAGIGALIAGVAMGIMMIVAVILGVIAVIPISVALIGGGPVGIIAALILIVGTIILAKATLVTAVLSIIGGVVAFIASFGFLMLTKIILDRANQNVNNLEVGLFKPINEGTPEEEPSEYELYKEAEADLNAAKGHFTSMLFKIFGGVVGVTRMRAKLEKIMALIARKGGISKLTDADLRKIQNELFYFKQKLTPRRRAALNLAMDTLQKAQDAFTKRLENLRKSQRKITVKIWHREGGEMVLGNVEMTVGEAFSELERWQNISKALSEMWEKNQYLLIEGGEIKIKSMDMSFWNIPALLSVGVEKYAKEWVNKNIFEAWEKWATGWLGTDIGSNLLKNLFAFPTRFIKSFYNAAFMGWDLYGTFRLGFEKMLEGLFVKGDYFQGGGAFWTGAGEAFYGIVSMFTGVAEQIFGAYQGSLVANIKEWGFWSGMGAWFTNRTVGRVIGGEYRTDVWGKGGWTGEFLNWGEAAATAIEFGFVLVETAVTLGAGAAAAVAKIGIKLFVGTLQVIAAAVKAVVKVIRTGFVAIVKAIVKAIVIGAVIIGAVTLVGIGLGIAGAVGYGIIKKVAETDLVTNIITGAVAVVAAVGVGLTLVTLDIAFNKGKFTLGILKAGYKVLQATGKAIGKGVNFLWRQIKFSRFGKAVAKLLKETVAGKLLTKAWKGITGVAQKAWTGIKSLFKAGGLKAAWEAVQKFSVKGFFKNIGKGIAKGIKTVFKEVTSELIDFGKVLISGSPKKLGEYIKGTLIYQALRVPFGPIMDLAEGIARSGWGWLKKTVKIFKSAVKSTVKGVRQIFTKGSFWKGVGNVSLGALKGLGTVGMGVLSPLAFFLDPVVDIVKKSGKAISKLWTSGKRWSAVFKFIGTPFSVIQSLAQNVMVIQQAAVRALIIKVFFEDPGEALFLLAGQYAYQRLTDVGEQLSDVAEQWKAKAKMIKGAVDGVYNLKADDVDIFRTLFAKGLDFESKGTKYTGISEAEFMKMLDTGKIILDDIAVKFKTPDFETITVKFKEGKGAGELTKKFGEDLRKAHISQYSSTGLRGLEDELMEAYKKGGDDIDKTRIIETLKDIGKEKMQRKPSNIIKDIANALKKISEDVKKIKEVEDLKSKIEVKKGELEKVKSDVAELKKAEQEVKKLKKAEQKVAEGKRAKANQKLKDEQSALEKLQTELNTKLEKTDVDKLKKRVRDRWKRGEFADKLGQDLRLEKDKKTNELKKKKLNELKKKKLSLTNAEKTQIKYEAIYEAIVDVLGKTRDRVSEMQMDRLTYKQLQIIQKNKTKESLSDEEKALLKDLKQKVDIDDSSFDKVFKEKQKDYMYDKDGKAIHFYSDKIADLQRALQYAENKKAKKEILDQIQEVEKTLKIFRQKQTIDTEPQNKFLKGFDDDKARVDEEIRQLEEKIKKDKDVIDFYEKQTEKGEYAENTKKLKELKTEQESLNKKREKLVNERKKIENDVSLNNKKIEKLDQNVKTLDQEIKNLEAKKKKGVKDTPLWQKKRAKKKYENEIKKLNQEVEAFKSQKSKMEDQIRELGVDRYDNFEKRKAVDQMNNEIIKEIQDTLLKQDPEKYKGLDLVKKIDEMKNSKNKLDELNDKLKSDYNPKARKENAKEIAKSLNIKSKLLTEFVDISNKVNKAIDTGDLLDTKTVDKYSRRLNVIKRKIGTKIYKKVKTKSKKFRGELVKKFDKTTSETMLIDEISDLFKNIDKKMDEQIDEKIEELKRGKEISNIETKIKDEPSNIKVKMLTNKISELSKLKEIFKSKNISKTEPLDLYKLETQKQKLIKKWETELGIEMKKSKEKRNFERLTTLENQIKDIKGKMTLKDDRANVRSEVIQEYWINRKAALQAELQTTTTTDAQKQQIAFEIKLLDRLQKDLGEGMEAISKDVSKKGRRNERISKTIGKLKKLVFKEVDLDLQRGKLELPEQKKVEFGDYVKVDANKKGLRDLAKEWDIEKRVVDLGLLGNIINLSTKSEVEFGNRFLTVGQEIQRRLSNLFVADVRKWYGTDYQTEQQKYDNDMESKIKALQRKKDKLKIGGIEQEEAVTRVRDQEINKILDKTSDIYVKKSTLDTEIYNLENLKKISLEDEIKVLDAKKKGLENTRKNLFGDDETKMKVMQEAKNKLDNIKDTNSADYKQKSAALKKLKDAFYKPFEEKLTKQYDDFDKDIKNMEKDIKGFQEVLGKRKYNSTLEALYPKNWGDNLKKIFSTSDDDLLKLRDAKEKREFLERLELKRYDTIIDNLKSRSSDIALYKVYDEKTRLTKIKEIKTKKKAYEAKKDKKIVEYGLEKTYERPTTFAQDVENYKKKIIEHGGRDGINFLRKHGFDIDTDSNTEIKLDQAVTLKRTYEKISLTQIGTFGRKERVHKQEDINRVNPNGEILDTLQSILKDTDLTNKEKAELKIEENIKKLSIREGKAEVIESINKKIDEKNKDLLDAIKNQGQELNKDALDNSIKQVMDDKLTFIESDLSNIKKGLTLNDDVKNSDIYNNLKEKKDLSIREKGIYEIMDREVHSNKQYIQELDNQLIKEGKFDEYYKNLTKARIEQQIKALKNTDDAFLKRKLEYLKNLKKSNELQYLREYVKVTKKMQDGNIELNKKLGKSNTDVLREVDSVNKKMGELGKDVKTNLDDLAKKSFNKSYEDLVKELKSDIEEIKKSGGVKDKDLTKKLTNSEKLIKMYDDVKKLDSKKYKALQKSMGELTDLYISRVVKKFDLDNMGKKKREIKGLDKKRNLSDFLARDIFQGNKLYFEQLNKAHSGYLADFNKFAINEIRDLGNVDIKVNELKQGAEKYTTKTIKAKDFSYENLSKLDFEQMNELFSKKNITRDDIIKATFGENENGGPKKLNKLERDVYRVITMKSIEGQHLLDKAKQTTMREYDLQNRDYDFTQKQLLMMIANDAGTIAALGMGGGKTRVYPTVFGSECLATPGVKGNPNMAELIVSAKQEVSNMMGNKDYLKTFYNVELLNGVKLKKEGKLVETIENLRKQGQDFAVIFDLETRGHLSHEMISDPKYKVLGDIGTLIIDEADAFSLRQQSFIQAGRLPAPTRIKQQAGAILELYGDLSKGEEGLKYQKRGGTINIDAVLSKEMLQGLKKGKYKEIFSKFKDGEIAFQIQNVLRAMDEVVSGQSIGGNKTDAVNGINYGVKDGVAINSVATQIFEAFYKNRQEKQVFSMNTFEKVVGESLTSFKAEISKTSVEASTQEILTRNPGVKLKVYGGSGTTWGAKRISEAVSAPVTELFEASYGTYPFKPTKIGDSIMIDGKPKKDTSKMTDQEYSAIKSKEFIETTKDGWGSIVIQSQDNLKNNLLKSIEDKMTPEIRGKIREITDNQRISPVETSMVLDESLIDPIFNKYDEKGNVTGYKSLEDVMQSGVAQYQDGKFVTPIGDGKVKDLKVSVMDILGSKLACEKLDIGSVGKKDFEKLNLNPKTILEVLVKKGWIDKKGVITEEFKTLKDKKNVKLQSFEKTQTSDIISILQQADVSKIRVFDDFTDPNVVNPIAKETSEKGYKVFSTQKAGRGMDFKGENRLLVLDSENIPRNVLLQILGRVGRGNARDTFYREVVMNPNKQKRLFTEYVEVLEQKKTFMDRQETKMDPDSEAFKRFTSERNALEKRISDIKRYEKEIESGKIESDVEMIKESGRILGEAKANGASLYQIGEGVRSTVLKIPLNKLLAKAKGHDAKMIQEIIDEMRSGRGQSAEIISTKEAGWNDPDTIFYKRMNGIFESAISVYKRLYEGEGMGEKLLKTFKTFVPKDTMDKVLDVAKDSVKDADLRGELAARIVDLERAKNSINSLKKQSWENLKHQKKQEFIEGKNFTMGQLNSMDQPVAVLAVDTAVFIARHLTPEYRRAGIKDTGEVKQVKIVDKAVTGKHKVLHKVQGIEADKVVVELDNMRDRSMKFKNAITAKRPRVIYINAAQLKALQKNKVMYNKFLNITQKQKWGSVKQYTPKIVIGSEKDLKQGTFSVMDNKSVKKGSYESKRKTEEELDKYFSDETKENELVVIKRDMMEDMEKRKEKDEKMKKIQKDRSMEQMTKMMELMNLQTLKTKKGKSENYGLEEKTFEKDKSVVITLDQEAYEDMSQTEFEEYKEWARGKTQVRKEKGLGDTTFVIRRKVFTGVEKKVEPVVTPVTKPFFDTKLKEEEKGMEYETQVLYTSDKEVVSKYEAVQEARKNILYPGRSLQFAEEKRQLEVKGKVTGKKFKIVEKKKFLGIKRNKTNIQ
ncbi:hypothetical protein ACFL5N_00145, partial [bacterium]